VLTWRDSDGNQLSQHDLHLLDFLFFLAFGATFEMLLIGIGSLIIASA
jgi:hypothetical protein